MSVCTLFSGLDKKALEEIAALSETVRVGQGKMLFSDGDIAHAFYVVAEGRLRIFKLSSSGREQTLMTPGPGICIAEAAVFTDGKYPAYSQAQEDSTLIRIDKDRFMKFLETKPRIAVNMIALLSERLKNFARKIEQLSLMGVVPRLAEYIAQMSDGKSDVTLDISKGELASLLGTVPETLSRALGKLKSAGYIRETGNSIRINNYEALREIAASYE